MSIYRTKVTYLKKPDYLKLKTYEDQSLDKDHEFNMVFGTKKAARISKSKTNDAIDISSDLLNNISTSCMCWIGILLFQFIILLFYFIADLMKSSTAASEFSVYLPVGCNRYSNKIDNIYPVSTLLLENEIDSMTDFAKEIITMMPIEDDNEL